jgi:hypothetical protein
MKIYFVITLLIFSFINLASQVSTKDTTLIVKKDYGYITYAEDFYRLYSLPLYYKEENLFQNIYFLQLALEAPFDFVNRALTIIKTEDEYQKYKDLLHMQFNYLIVKNYIYLAGLYDKENYYFYNAQFKDEIKSSFEYASYFYNLAIDHWGIVESFSEKVADNKSSINMDILIDRAYKIKYGEIDYAKTAKRKLKEIDEKILMMN